MDCPESEGTRLPRCASLITTQWTVPNCWTESPLGLFMHKERGAHENSAGASQRQFKTDVQIPCEAVIGVWQLTYRDVTQPSNYNNQEHGPLGCWNFVQLLLITWFFSLLFKKSCLTQHPLIIRKGTTLNRWLTELSEHNITVSQKWRLGQQNIALNSRRQVNEQAFIWSKRCS